MQVLWSRAAQTRSSCRCCNCLNAATAIARRTTTAASTRRLKVGDLFTACYSTILATAAFADAKVKEDRRKEWDRVIEEAKAGMPTEELEVPGRIHTATMADFFSRRATYSPMAVSDEEGRARTASKPIPAIWNGTSWKASCTTRDMPLEPQLRKLEAHLKQSLEPSPHTFTQTRASSDDSIDGEEEWVEEVDPSLQLGPREPKSRLHLDKMEEMIAKLVARLLLGIRAFSSLRGSEVSGNVDISWQMKDMVERIEALHKGATRLPAYSWPDDQSVQEERRELHRSMTALHKTTLKSFDSDLMLAKMCYNLLISTSPPSITTYNILIDSLTQLGQHDLAQVVVDSFLYDSKYRPSPATIHVILSHYTAKNDQAGFKAMIERMRSVNGDMRIGKRALCLLPIPGVQKWATANKVIHRAGSFIHKVPRTSKIFESLIQGSLRMTSLTSAVRYIRAALREGAPLKSEIIFEVMRACVTEADYRAGKSLLTTILSQWECGAIFPDVAYSKDVRWCIYQLLHLCGIDLSLELKQKLPIKASRDALQSMLRHLRLESVADSIHQFAARLSAVDEVLEVPHFQPISRPLKDRDRNKDEKRGHIVNGEGVEQACNILQTASKIERRRLTLKKRSLARAQFLKLQVIESRLATVAKRIKTYERQLLFILFHRLSWRGQLEYLRALRKNQSKTMAVRLALLLHTGRGERNLKLQPRMPFTQDLEGIDKIVFTIRKVGSKARERERGVLTRRFVWKSPKTKAVRTVKMSPSWARTGNPKKGLARREDTQLMYRITSMAKRKKDTIFSVAPQPGPHCESKPKMSSMISKPSPCSATREIRPSVPSSFSQPLRTPSPHNAPILLPLAPARKQSELGAAAG